MSGRKSREKGARGEREAARFLTSLGFECTRNARNGISTGDLHGLELCLPGVVVEVKFGYASMDLHTADLRNAWYQAEASVCDANGIGPDTAYRAQPTVLWKPPRKPWRLTWMHDYGLCTVSGPDAIKAALLGLSKEAA